MDDEDLIPISVLQHYRYCPGRCALIHIERLWAESQHTAKGRLLHEHADNWLVVGAITVRRLRTLLCCLAEEFHPLLGERLALSLINRLRVTDRDFRIPDNGDDVSTMTAAGAKSLRRAAKVCRDYGQRVQLSVLNWRLTLLP